MPKPSGNKEAISHNTDATASRQNKSVANAKSAFSKFTLSKQSTRRSTRRFVDKTQTVASQQREAINRQLETPPASSGPGMTIVASTEQASAMLKAGTMELAGLLNAMDKARVGTQFYAAGTALVEKIEIQTTIDTFFTKLRDGGNGK